MRALPVALIALALAPVAVAATGSGLVLKRVTEPPRSVAAGDDFVVKAKIKNVGPKPRRGIVTIRLIGGSGAYALPRRIGRFNTGTVEPRFFKRYTVRLTVPPDQGEGRYRLETCVKGKGTPRQCDVSKRFRVTPAR